MNQPLSDIKEIRNNSLTLLALRERAKDTPDFLTLKKNSENFLVFIYDSMMTGKKVQQEMKQIGGTTLGRAVTLNRQGLILRHNGIYPIAFRFTRDFMRESGLTINNFGYISGEVFEVDLYGLTLLDKKYHNNGVFKRETVDVTLKQQKHTPIVSVFMYLGIEKVFKGLPAYGVNCLNNCGYSLQGAQKTYNWDGEGKAIH